MSVYSKGAALAAALLLTGCITSSQADFKPLLTAEPKATDHNIEVYEGDSLPQRAYSEVAILDVHLEATHLISHTFADALPKLKTQARAAGGDAIIAIKETRSRYLETSMYHVTATAIRFDD